MKFQNAKRDSGSSITKELAKSIPKSEERSRFKTLYLLKQKKRKEAKITLSLNNPYRYKNSDKFVEKRFERNPRFTIWRRYDLEQRRMVSFIETFNSQLPLSSIDAKVSQTASDADKLLIAKSRNVKLFIVPKLKSSFPAMASKYKHATNS